MSTSPNYGFYRKPRFSVNQLADYLHTSHAGQREKIIQSAKFPKKPAVAPYSTARRIICDFLGINSNNFVDLDRDLKNLGDKARREPDGWMKDELLRSIEAIRMFKDTFKNRRLKIYNFVAAPKDISMSLEGVSINTRLAISILETDKEGVTHNGGCVLFFAASERKNLPERSKAVAATIYWQLSDLNSNLEPLPRLCWSFDVFGSEIIKATDSYDRLRSRIRHSCREAAARWDEVEPPADYDGPDWQ